MKIKFNSVKIENFMSLGCVNIDLDSRGYVLVSGINKNDTDSARSNGSGKSSIFDAIMWCATGQTIRGNKDVTNLFGNDGALVELCFESDKHQYTLLRSKNHSIHKTNLKITIDGEDKSGKGIRDTEKLLIEYLPDLTHQLLGSVVLLGQGLPSRFTNNSPSGRKETLERLCKSDFMIQDLKERISKRKASLEAELRTHEDTNLELSVKMDLLKKESAEISQKLSDNEDIQELQKSLQTLNEHIVKATAEYTEICREAETLKQQYDNALREANAVTNERNTRLQEADSELKSKVSEYNYSIRAKKDELLRLKSTMQEMLSIKDVCPTCGQRLVNVVKPDTTSIEASIEDLSVEISNLESRREIEFTESKIQKANIQEHYSAMVKDKEAEVSKFDNELSNMYTNRNTMSEYLCDTKLQLANIESKIEWETKERAQVQDRYIQIQDEIQLLSDKQLYTYKTIEDIKSRIDVVSKFNSIVSREFRGYLLSGVIDYVNSRAKMYSTDIFGSDLITFSLDGNNISISFAGKEYESLSGGEKQKVDLIIQFSIRDMLCAHSGFSTNIIVLDEIFDNLDDVGCSKVIDMLSSRLSDVSSAFIITHHGSELNIPYDDELVVVKDSNGVSYIQ